jgi:Uma2 family endonuclease
LSIAVETIEELPPIDERLALPEAGYEIIDGVVTFVVPSDPPHGERHSKVSALVEAHVHADFTVASDMLTRTSKIDDIAPDVSVFPRERDPVTGRRRLEQLAFEIVSTGSMSRATTKAAKLSGRGVRRVFAIDLERGRVIEWQQALASWRVLALDDHIADPVLAVSLSVNALLNAGNVDDEVARALVAKRNPVIEEARLESRAEGIAEGQARGLVGALITVLSVRGLVPTGDQRERIMAERDLARLDRWIVLAATCASVDELLAS